MPWIYKKWWNDLKCFPQGFVLTDRTELHSLLHCTILSRTSDCKSRGYIIFFILNNTWSGWTLRQISKRTNHTVWHQYTAGWCLLVSQSDHRLCGRLHACCRRSTQAALTMRRLGARWLPGCMWLQWTVSGYKSCPLLDPHNNICHAWFRLPKKERRKKRKDKCMLVQDRKLLWCPMSCDLIL